MAFALSHQENPILYYQPDHPGATSSAFEMQCVKIKALPRAFLSSLVAHTAH